MQSATCTTALGQRTPRAAAPAPPPRRAAHPAAHRPWTAARAAARVGAGRRHCCRRRRHCRRACSLSFHRSQSSLPAVYCPHRRTQPAALTRSSSRTAPQAWAAPLPPAPAAAAAQPPRAARARGPRSAGAGRPRASRPAGGSCGSVSGRRWLPRRRRWRPGRRIPTGARWRGWAAGWVRGCRRAAPWRGPGGTSARPTRVARPSAPPSATRLLDRHALPQPRAPAGCPATTAPASARPAGAAPGCPTCAEAGAQERDPAPEPAQLEGSAGGGQAAGGGGRQRARHGRKPCGLPTLPVECRCFLLALTWHVM